MPKIPKTLKKTDKYAIVIFPESNEVEVVATNWLDIPNGLCWWPPKRWALITITKGVRSRLTPDETWGKYPALIMYSTETYEKARQKLPEAEATSDVATTSDADELSSSKLKRKKRPNKRYVITSSSDDDADEGDTMRERNSLPRPPPVSKPLPQPKPTQRVLFSASTPRKANEDERLELTGNSVPNDPVEHTPGAASSGIQKILKLLLEMKHDLKELKHQMQNQTTRDSVNMLEDLPEDIVLPLTSMENLDELEHKLKDKHLQDVLVNHVSIVGGENTAAATRKMMASLISNELATKFNWIGKGAKRGFGQLLLAGILLRAVRKNNSTASATKSDVEGVAKNWLRYAHDRLGARKLRNYGQIRMQEQVDTSAERNTTIATENEGDISDVSD